MKYSVIFRSLLAVVLLGFMAQTRAEEKKIVVLSDVHVMAKSLEGTEFWNTTVEHSRKIAECSQPLFDQLVDTLKHQKPDLVLITGDLTEGGKLESHEYVKDKLDELRAAGLKIFVIPGNHDLTGTVNFAEFYKDYGYSDATAQEELSYVAEPFPGLTLLGINSGTDGKLSEETLNFAVTQARAATEKGNQIICMMHHALLPHISYANVLIPSSNVADWENVREQLACAGIRVVLSGHFHVSDIAMDLTNDLSRSIYDISTGSIVSYPSDYRVLTYSDNPAEMKVETRRIMQMEGKDNFPSWSRKELKDRLVRLVMNNLQLDKEQDSSVYQLATEVLDSLAGVFAVHAEGNEVMTQERQDLVDQLKSMASLVQSVMVGAYGADSVKEAGIDLPGFADDMMTSILTDKSPYGYKDRENITNDRTLVIELGEPSSSVPSAIRPSELSKSKERTERWFDMLGRAINKEGRKGIFINENGEKIIQ
ncbi:MAG: metallophosphoesterase [Prevotella sp.]|nr:metallophosphoesterase [Prevotella sp.]